MNDKKPLVVVFSRIHTTGLSIIRSLGAAGYPVDLVACSHRKGLSSIAASSKYVGRSVEVVVGSVKMGRDQGEAPLLDELLKYAGAKREKPVLFPTDDYTASVVDRNKHILLRHFRLPEILEGEAGSLVRMMDKFVQGEMAREVGLRVPKQWMITLEKAIEIPDDMVYPCFCKPLESVSGDKLEMASCKDERALITHLETLRRRFSGRSVLVQEFLKIDRELDLSGVCADQEVVIPGLIRKTRVAEYNRGVTLTGEVVPLEELGEIADKIASLMRRFHYIGMFDMELNVVGDEIYFNEVNLRCGGPNYAYYASGVNLPALAVDAICGVPWNNEEGGISEFGKSFVYEKVAWEDYIHGYMAKKELRRMIQKADITLLHSRDDPKPGKYFSIMIRLIGLKFGLEQVKKNGVLAIRRTVSSFRKWILRYPQTMKKNRRDAASQFPRILILGRNYGSNLCMARSFGEAGYETEVIRVLPAPQSISKRIIPLMPDAYSKYIKAYHVCITRGDSRILVDKLIGMADPDRKMLLIPTDDFTAGMVDAYQDTLREYFYLPNVNDHQDGINHLMRKEIQHELASKAGLPVVSSCLVSTLDGRFEIPEGISYPCFIKPNTSKNTNKTQIRRCDSPEELREALEKLSRDADVEMLVQDYLDIKQEYALLGLSTPEGVVAPGFFATEAGGHGPRKGVTLVGRLCDTQHHQELIDDICRFVGTLGYVGLFDVDLIETQDGRMFFIELNLRYGASGYAVTGSGIDLPGMYADYVFKGKAIDEECAGTATGKTFINDKVALEEYMDGFLTWKQMDRMVRSADIHFIRNAADPAAYRHFSRFFLAASLMRTARCVKNRMKAIPAIKQNVDHIPAAAD